MKSGKKKLWIPIVAVLAIFAIVLIVISGTHSKAKVVYLLPDGTEFHPGNAKNGSDIKVPDNPQMPEGWIFTGWSFSNAAPDDGAGSSELVPSGKPDTKNTVYARAEAVHVPVFDTGLALAGGYGTKKDHVTLPLKLCGEVNICAFEAEIHYDPGQLKFVEFANTDPGVVINVIEEEGCLLLNYLDSENTLGDVDLVDLVFEIIGESDTDTPVEITVENGTRLNDAGEMEDVDVLLISSMVTIVK